MRERGIDTTWALVASVPRTSPASACTARSLERAEGPADGSAGETCVHPRTGMLEACITHFQTAGWAPPAVAAGPALDSVAQLTGSNPRKLVGLLLSA